MNVFSCVAESAARAACRLRAPGLALVLVGCGADLEMGDSAGAGSALDAGAAFADAGTQAGGRGGENGQTGGEASGGAAGGGAAPQDSGLGQGGGAPTGGAGGGGGATDAGQPPPPTREEACAWLAGQGAAPAVTDQDGDCFPSACPPGDGSCARLVDCDDQRPDVNPGAAELCNGRDDDCDGRDDQTFAVGGPCETTCGDGKWECAIQDPTRTACSTAAGQSQAPPPASVREVCDGRDDDCDGVVDDDCRLALPVALQRSQPAVCGARVFLVQDDALVEVDEGGVVDTLAAAGEELPVAPTCGPGGIAWLSLPMNGGQCETPADGPERCYGRILARRLDAAPGTPPIEIATPGAHGRPAVTDSEVLWHSVVGQSLAVYARPLAPEGASRRMADDQSDPALGGAAAGVSPYVATRLWVSGSAQVFLQDLRAPRDGLALINPVAPPGPPVFAGAWLVWDIPGALWGVPMDGPTFSEVGAGLQLTEHGPGEVRPLLDGTRLIWLDRETSPPSVRLVDLETGLDRTIVRADIRPGDLAVSGGVLYTIRQEAPDAGLYRTTLP